MTPTTLFEDGSHIRLLLDSLGHDLDPSILIGGWATHLRVGGDISYDIDLILGDHSVRARLRERADELSESTQLAGRKIRGTVEGVHLDVYVPFQSTLGEALLLRVEELAKFTDPKQTPDQSWVLLTIEAHTITKMAALLDRHATVKGAKDANEIVLLLTAGVDSDGACEVLVAATAGEIRDVPKHIDAVFGLVSERAHINKAQRRWLAGLRRTWADSAARAVQLATTPEPPRPRLL